MILVLTLTQAAFVYGHNLRVAKLPHRLEKEQQKLKTWDTLVGAPGCTARERWVQWGAVGDNAIRCFGT